jgi:thiol:disulfide interchange protein
MRMKLLCCVMTAVFVSATAAPAQVDEMPASLDAILGGSGNMSISLIASHSRVVPGQTVNVALVVTLEEGWSMYSPAPVASDDYQPIPAEVKVVAPMFEEAEVFWPADELHSETAGDSVLDSYVYGGRVVIYARLRVKDDAAQQGSGEIELWLTGQTCTDSQCLPPFEKRHRVRLDFGEQAQVSQAWTEELAEGMVSSMTLEQLVASRGGEGEPAVVAEVADRSVWVGLGMALLAGLILNVMPCVLPVIPIRILSIVEASQHSRRRYVVLALAFAGGIVLFFFALAVAGVVFREVTGRALNWAAHYQSGAFRAGMALLLAALAANLFGAFAVLVPRRISAIEAGRTGGGMSLIGSAGMGVMMAILSTPCSFAVLVLAMAWAQTQPTLLGALAVTLVGVGMAAPHALLAAFPSLVDKLPKPGRWMELLKQSMGFAILGFAVWLIGTLVTADEDRFAVQVMAFGVVLTAALWIWGNWVKYDASFLRKLAIRGTAVVLTVGAGFVMLSPPAESAVDYVPFDEAQMLSARADGQTVVVKFTATWCLSCRVVDATVFRDDTVIAALADPNVLVMKADVSNAGTPAADYLKSIKGAVPITVVFPPDRGEPTRLVGKFKPQDLLDALE